MDEEEIIGWGWNKKIKLIYISITIVFIVLKLVEVSAVAQWSWWWVLSPLWLPTAIVLGIMGIIGLGALIFINR